MCFGRFSRSTANFENLNLNFIISAVNIIIDASKTIGPNLN